MTIDFSSSFHISYKVFKFLFLNQHVLNRDSLPADDWRQQPHSVVFPLRCSCTIDTKCQGGCNKIFFIVFIIYFCPVLKHMISFSDGVCYCIGNLISRTFPYFDFCYECETLNAFENEFSNLIGII